MSRIEWTDKTWNPVTGCTIVSEGCKNCYAMRQAHRLAKNFKMGAYKGTTRISGGRPKWTGKINLVPRMLELPYEWKKPRLIFVNSMSDLFHEDIPLEYLLKVFKVMNECRDHTFQILTKRADRLRELADELPWTENIWIGVSIENRKTYDRINVLNDLDSPIPYKIRRFISFEPLLEDVSTPFAIDHLDSYKRKVDWVIVGGESGPKARPVERDWIEYLRLICQPNGIPFFFKQWGGTNKKKTGNELDGKKYEEIPEPLKKFTVNPKKTAKRAVGTQLDLFVS